MLSASLSDNSSTSAKVINAFCLAGTFLDVFGAILSTPTAWWLEVLEPEHAETLEMAWANRANRANLRTRQVGQLSRLDYSQCLIFRFGNNLRGRDSVPTCLLIYIWTKQPLLVSILATIPVAVLTPFLATTLLFPSGRKENVIYILAAKRGAWWWSFYTELGWTRHATVPKTHLSWDNLCLSIWHLPHSHPYLARTQIFICIVLKLRKKLGWSTWAVRYMWIVTFDFPDII